MFKADGILSNIECITPLIITTSTGTYTLTVESPSQIILEGTAANQIIKLPDATTLELGLTYLFWNKSTKKISIVDNGDHEVALVIATARTRITLENNTTANGTWAIEPPIYPRLLNLTSTGILEGGIITVNANHAKFDISDGCGVVVNNYTDTDNPTITHVEWTGKTAISVTNLATVDATWIGIDASGNVIQQTSLFTSDQQRDIMVLGSLGHPSRTQIDYVTPFTTVAYEPMSQFVDFAEAFGPFNVQGNAYGANGANFHVNKSAGKCFRIGCNYDVNKKVPNISTNDALTALYMLYVYRNGSGVWVSSAPTQNVDPEHYDNDTTPLPSVSSGKWTIQQFYFAPGINVTGVIYGQVVYDSKEAAKAAVYTATAINPYFEYMVFRGWLVVQQGCTRLNDINTAEFIASSKFGLVSVQSGAGIGEANTASNVGTAGVGFYKQKSGVDLQFKNLKSLSTRITVADNPGDNTVALTLGGIKSGIVVAGSFAGNPKKATVTFVTPFADATYNIDVTGVDARVWSYESKAAGSFVINANANQALTGEVSWRCAVAENI